MKCLRNHNSYTRKSFENLLCVDMSTCTIVSPLEQLRNYVTNVETRLKQISKENFLEVIINLATEEALSLHMH